MQIQKGRNELCVILDHHRREKQKHQDARKQLCINVAGPKIILIEWIYGVQSTTFKVIAVDLTASVHSGQVDATNEDLFGNRK